MALEHWIGKTAHGEKVEYFYNQADRGCWASRKIGDLLQRHDPAKRGLMRKEVEALFGQTIEPAGHGPEN